VSSKPKALSELSWRIYYASWRIYYANGRKYDSERGTPAEATPTGVIAIVQKRDSLHWPYEVVHRFDWYWWRPDERAWYGGDTYGMIDQMMHCGAMWPKQGRAVSDDQFAKIIHQATHDPDFPIGGKDAPS
jgi:hypothetical protein